MKKYVVCLECGRKLCKAEPGSVVEMYCPTCKKNGICRSPRRYGRNHATRTSIKEGYIISKDNNRISASFESHTRC